MVVVVLAGGCGEALQNFNIVSDAQEMQMGQVFSTQLERDLRLYDDPVVVAYIVDLGQRLTAVSQRSDITYQIKVVDTDDVNAFAVPGGYLYMNRGLISHAENESELAGVMGHEVGHIVGRHGSKQISKQYGLQFVTALILGGGNPSIGNGNDFVTGTNSQSHESNEEGVSTAGYTHAVLDVDIGGESFFQLGNFRPEDISPVIKNGGDAGINLITNAFLASLEVDEFHQFCY